MANDTAALAVAIEHAIKVAYSYTKPDCACATEHKQLALWLTELLQLKLLLNDHALEHIEYCRDAMYGLWEAEDESEDLASYAIVDQWLSDVRKVLDNAN